MPKAPALALASLIALPLALFSAPAQAAAEPEEDLRLLAEQRGLSLAEARARYGWQEAFAAVAAQAERRFPAQFAAASIGDGAASIAFKGEIPEEAAALAARVPAPVKLLAHQGYSRAELKATLEAQHHRILNEPGIAHVTSYHHPGTGAITIEAVPASKPADPEALRARLQPAQTLRSGITVSVKLAETASGGDDAARGSVAYLRGGGMLNLPSGKSHCTAGFVVKTANGTGITTAHHCADAGIDTLRYYRHGSSGSDYTVVSKRTALPRQYGDVIWYSRGTYTPSPTFHHTWDHTRDVLGTGTAVPGQDLCHFGRSTGRVCSTVHSLDVCRDGYCGLTATADRSAAPGNSGGPWYYGNTAYGIHKGHGVFDGADRDLFTPIGALSHLNVSVLTP
ncbi:S1 family peptidase [Nonomuraea rubra]|uniref:S1 family peptidase n=1 Tax=Nonomuraea rubra TaxID=46180 RepID=UPI0033E78901